MIEKLLAKVEKRYPIDVATKDDMEQIVQVYNEVWPDKEKQHRFLQRFRHRYLENPFSRGFESIVVARDGDRIVGFTGSMDFELWYHDRMVPATCSIDQAVLPSYQSVGIGYLLLKHIYERTVIAVAGDLNPAAQRLHRNMRVREISCCYMLRRWCRPGDFLRAWSDLDMRVEEGCELDTRFDELWSVARGTYQIVGVRNESTLQWRYKNHPMREFRIYGLSRGPQLFGYAVTTMGEMKGGRRKGILVDNMFAPLPSDTIAKFISYVVGKFAKQGALCVDTLCSHWRTLNILKDLGFSCKQDNPHFVVYDNNATKGKNDLWDGSSWHLTFGDSDFYLT